MLVLEAAKAVSNIETTLVVILSQMTELAKSLPEFQQRVTIARAMMKNPDYLILDEATANLDPATEEKIRKAVAALTQGRTTIIVAHSFRAIQDADQVIVMNGGVLEDQGTIDELKARNGFFQALAEASQA